MPRAPAALGAALALAVSGCGAATARPRGGPTATAPVRAAQHRVPPVDPATAPLPAGDLGAWIRHPVTLRASPDGRAVARVGLRTRFGSPRILAIARRRGPWLGVIAAQRDNGRLAWVRLAAVRLVSEPVRIRIDLPARELEVRRGSRALLRIPVGIGAPGTPTPTGTFSVTDLLALDPGSPYGCCVLALSGHQPDVAQGWTGGDRLAVHGTSDAASVGAALSHGCLRARDRDLRRLLRLVPLGARVEIRP